MFGEVFRSGRFSARHVGVVVQGIGEPMTGKEAPFGPLLAERSTGSFRTYPRLVQAMPRGAEEIELTSEHWTPRYAYARLPEDYPGQAEDAAAIARLFVSERVRYSFASYAALAAWQLGLKAERLARWIDRRGKLLPGPRMPFRLDARSPEFVQLPVEAICSVVGDQSWTLTGKDVVQGTRSQIVTPGMLATACIRTPKVILGWPG